MMALLWLVPALPLAGFMVLVLTQGRLSQAAVSAVGVGSVGLSAAVAGLVGWDFLHSELAETAYSQMLWTWMSVAGFDPGVTLYLDALSLVMMWIITGVGFLIHLFSTGYMDGDPGYSRYFAYLNLFVAMMLLLVLGDNLLLLYLGWEGVGLCSYLLIGFWYRDAANGTAARKAFIVTRVGDTAMALGLFLLFMHLGTLDIQTLMTRAESQWAVGSPLPVIAALLLLGGAVGKSAQLPLQTWLPDAMAGPTPVSALIHAATMVTAGVYLIARTHVLYELAPDVQYLVALVGGATLLLAGFTALVQNDIKRILAWSTISQIGYMFLALGVGAWSAGIFHLMTHAFFKALLFLAAGAVLIGLHHEQDIRAMGGLRSRMPLAFWSFLIGSAALAALPLVTAGFYSKDLILWEAWASPAGGVELWLMGIVGAFLTAVYIFRGVFIAFFGEYRGEHTDIREDRRLRIWLPLGALSVLSIVGGFIHLPLDSVLPAGVGHTHSSTEYLLQVVAGAITLIGIGLAWLLFRPGAQWRFDVAPMRRLLFSGFGFDWLYDRLLVQPFVFLSRLNRNDAVDTGYDAVAWSARLSHRTLSLTQTGHLRWYAAAVAGGAVLVLGIALF